MTTFGCLFVGLLIGYFGGHLTGRLLSLVLWKIHGEEYDREFPRVIGGILMAFEAILVGFIAAVVGYHAGASAAAFAGLMALVVIPLAAVPAVLLFDDANSNLDENNLAERVFRSPITLYVISWDFCYKVGTAFWGLFKKDDNKQTPPSQDQQS